MSRNFLPAKLPLAILFAVPVAQPCLAKKERDFTGQPPATLN